MPDEVVVGIFWTTIINWEELLDFPASDGSKYLDTSDVALADMDFPVPKPFVILKLVCEKTRRAP